MDTFAYCYLQSGHNGFMADLLHMETNKTYFISITYIFDLIDGKQSDIVDIQMFS